MKQKTYELSTLSKVEAGKYRRRLDTLGLEHASEEEDWLLKWMQQTSDTLQPFTDHSVSIQHGEHKPCTSFLKYFVSRKEAAKLADHLSLMAQTLQAENWKGCDGETALV